MGTNDSCLPSQACERDVQCGTGTCCAISLWLRGLRMCTPLGREGDECHPGSRKVLHRLAQGREPATQLGLDPDFQTDSRIILRVFGTASLLFGESLG